MTWHGAKSQRLIEGTGLRFGDQSDPGNSFYFTFTQKCFHDQFPDPGTPPGWENNKVLDVAIRNAIGNNPAHSDRAAALFMHCNREEKTPSDKCREILKGVHVLPPAAGPVQIRDLVDIP